MPVSRRNVLRLGSMILTAAAAPSWALDRRGAALDRLDFLAREDFASALNTSFEATASNGARLWMKLVSVEEIAAPPAPDLTQFAVRPRRPLAPPPATTPFKLRFLSSTDFPAQDTYTLKHVTLGSFSLLLVPGGNSTFVATINRLAGPRTPGPAVRAER